jgi:tryptophanase
MFGHRDPASGEMVYPKLELVRLAIPRRVYTTQHVRYVADAVIELYRKRESLKGLKIVHEAPVLRHFTARLEELSGAAAPAPSGTPAGAAR